jgi:uncharacterized protein (DUF3084 family)
MRLVLEEMRDVHQYELEQARQEHEGAASSAQRIISQEKESAEQKIRELETALQRAKQEVLSVQDDRNLLDRRLSQSALESVKMKEVHDRVCAQKQDMEAELKRVSSQLEEADYQVFAADPDASGCSLRRFVIPMHRWGFQRVVSLH